MRRGDRFDWLWAAESEDRIDAYDRGTVKLKGVLKGVDITDEDISAAHKSLYSKIEILHR